MDRYFRIFLVAEGPKNGYPDYKKNKISITVDDPANCNFENSFLCSPLFSLSPTGSTKIPEVKDKIAITFFIVPNVFPTFYHANNLDIDTDYVWTSIGLANLIVFDTPCSTANADTIFDFLKSNNKVVGAERWVIEDNRISEPILLHSSAGNNMVQSGIKISEKLPLNIKFSVSEFLISVDKFLTASKRFTPHYFTRHQKTIIVSTKRLIADLSFLSGDSSFDPSAAVINSLSSKDKSQAFTNLSKEEFKEKVEEQINDRHGRIVHFVSALSYLYSQAYAGTFPLFDHNGLIRRHSLLGIGSAIGALYELVCQIEETFSFLPFYNFKEIGFTTENIPRNYLTIFSDPSNHSQSIFKDDPVSRQIKEVTAKLSKQTDNLSVPSDYYNRISFFSGRLGFREYDFSATAAIQVLVEAHTLDFHVINYTHEIIHNHVRIILTHGLINVPESIRSEDYDQWIIKVLKTLEDIQHGAFNDAMHYDDYFKLILLNYCINARYFGSLSKGCNEVMITENRITYQLPDPIQLKLLLKEYYRDINEIFVHVIDFCYIYKRDIKSYVLSIWVSWSTIPSVTKDLQQYVIRTLIVLALNTNGSAKNRFEEAKSTFLAILPTLAKRRNSIIFDQIGFLLRDERNLDLMYRFENCVIVADIVYNFFVGNIELLLENGDQGVVAFDSSVDQRDDDEIANIYDTETGYFTEASLKSKVVFLLDQLIREVNRSNHSEIGDQEKERLSSWLLLSLSSNINS